MECRSDLPAIFLHAGGGDLFQLHGEADGIGVRAEQDNPQRTVYAEAWAD
ncbi:MAG TPA: hypothetical protein VIT22_11375 [Pseudoxanthomonas sp.]